MWSCLSLPTMDTAVFGQIEFLGPAASSGLLAGTHLYRAGASAMEGIGGFFLKIQNLAVRHIY